MKQIIKRIFSITTIRSSGASTDLPDPPLPASRHAAFKQLLSLSDDLPRPKRTQERKTAV